MFLRVVHKEKSAEMTVFQQISYNRVIVWWCHQESNRGHKDFQYKPLKITTVTLSVS